MSPHSEPYYSGSESSEFRSDSPPTLASSVNGENGHCSKYHERSRHVLPSSPDSEFDLVCVGFGPASLAVAVALHDAIAAGRRLNTTTPTPKVLFLEKQNRFAWHAGMLLPGAKMQISFVKDLATLRDPRSEFTFLNYLHRQGRLVDFTNLSTFLPARLEYEDYMRWCATFFEDVVSYGQRVVSVSPEKGASGPDGVQTFRISSENVHSGCMQTFKARNVLIATGGQPSLPRNFPSKHPRVIHSSQYAHAVPQLLPKRNAPHRVAVVGAGQSAAEIFFNVQSLYPNSKTYLVMRPEFLRPSDDSPFVNSVFNPEYIDELYPKSASYRSNLLTEARATNYGVVRLELIEQIFERMYDQRRELGPDERAWPHRILGGRQIASLQGSDDGPLELRVRKIETSSAGGTLTPEGFAPDTKRHEDDLALEVDLVIAATGYQRAAHVDMLRDTWDMLPVTVPADETPASLTALKGGVTGWDVQTDHGERKLAVGRDYQVRYAPGTVGDNSGVWLQGCCEGTHGLSDTLLSVLATRSGEIVDSIFGAESSK